MTTATESPAIRRDMCRDLLAAINREGAMLPLHKAHSEAIAKTIPGWSGWYHHLFFTALLSLPEIKNILILGVYQGRDIAFMLNAAKGRAVSIVGVDRFKDEACEDWADHAKKMTWEQAGFGHAPSLAKAYEHITPRITNSMHEVQLVESDDADWLLKTAGEKKYDAIYIDTAHDKATVVRQLAQIKPFCHETTIVCGDDYAPVWPTWGVDKAVGEAFSDHHVVKDIIWFADAANLT